MTFFIYFYQKKILQKKKVNNSQLKIKLKANNNKKHEIDGILDNVIYTKK